MTLGPYPEISWSISKASKFKFCPRRYYYSYHGSWLGWENSAPERTKLIYMLNKRSSLPAWAGTETHRGISINLRTDKDMPSIIENVKQRMQQQFRDSRAKHFLQNGQAKTSFGLREHYYEEKIEDSKVVAAWEKVENSLNAFIMSPYKSQVINAKKNGKRVFIENPDVENFDRMKVFNHSLGDFPIFAAPDIVITNEDNSITIYDWKTGSESEQNETTVTDQLVLYSLWVKDRFGIGNIDDQQINAFEVYLPSLNQKGNRVTENDIEDTLENARESVAEIRNSIRDPEQNIAYEEDFTTVDSGKCYYCEFRGICSK